MTEGKISYLVKGASTCTQCGAYAYPHENYKSLCEHCGSVLVLRRHHRSR